MNLLFSGPGATARYGANQIVRVEIGNINFIRGCVPGPSRGGFPDFLQPAADLYIVDAGRNFTNMTPLVDVAGEANTAIGGTAGAFFNLPLGLTSPAGRIPSGTYDVVVDECQNGMWDTGQDTVVRDAFTVDVDEIVPGFDTDAAEWNNLKRVAKAQLGGGITDLEKLYVQIVAAELFDKIYSSSTATISPSAFAGFAISFWITQNDPFAKARAKGKEFIRATATSRRRAVGNLAADPPDPAFQQFASPTRFAPAQPADLAALDDLQVAVTLFDALGSVEDAFVQAVERYQGAQEGGSAIWATRHARTLDELATLHGELNTAFVAAMATLTSPYENSVDPTFTKSILLRNAYSSTFVPYTAQGYEARASWWNSGETAADTEAALAEWWGLIDAPTNQGLLSGLLGYGAQAQDTAEEGLELSTAMRTWADATLPALLAELALVNDVDDPAVGIAPVTGAAGAASVPLAITLPPGVVADAVSWDLDGDGLFDDAFGDTPTWEVPGTAVAGSLWVIGAEVQTPDGADTAYQAVPIGVGNRRPDVVAVAEGEALGAAGAAATFEASATDPDGDAVTVEWLVDDVVVQTGGTTLDVAVPVDFFGQQSVTFVATDEHGARALGLWELSVRTGIDADGDTFEAFPGPDCDDASAVVHPNRPEVIGNTIDDDCNPLTSDTPGAQGTSAGSIASEFFAGVEGDQRTISISNWAHVNRFNNVPFTLEVAWGDGTTSIETVQGTTPMDTTFVSSHHYRREVVRGAFTWCVYEGAGTGGALIGCGGGPARVDIVNNGPFVNTADHRTWSADNSGVINPDTCVFGPTGCNTTATWVPNDPDGRALSSVSNPNEDIVGFSPVDLPEGGYGRAMVELSVLSGFSDNDAMGFVLGYQDDEIGGLNGASDDFLVFDWFGQNTSTGVSTNPDECNGFITNGLDARIKTATWSRNRGPSSYSERIWNVQLDIPDDGSGTEDPLCYDDFGVENLQRIEPWPEGSQIVDRTANTGPWLRLALSDNTVGTAPYGPVKVPYRYTVDYRPDRLRMWTANGTLVTDIVPPNPADPFPPGALGVFFWSQAGVRATATRPEPQFVFVEGTSGGITMPFTDGGIDETYTVTIDWGDESSATAGISTADPATGVGWYTASGDHVYKRTGDYRGEVCVVDDTGDGTCFTFRATVANLPPVVDAGPDVTGAADLISGATVDLDEATFTDPGAYDDHTATIDWGDGSLIEVGVVIENRSSGGTVTGSHTYASDGEYDVEVCVTDHPGLTDCDTLTVDVRVVNQAPSAFVELPTSVLINQDVAIGGGFTDPNPDDTHTITIDPGDGTGPIEGEGQDLGSFGSAGIGVIYAVPGTYVVTVCVTDAALVEDCASADLVVDDDGTSNRAPVADAGGPYTVNEGSSVVVDGSASSDPDGDTVTLSWDLDGDGVFDTSDAAPSVVGPDGPASLSVAVEACDPDLLCATDATQIVVVNVDPVIDGVGTSLADTEATVTVTFSDAGILDTHVVSVEWGDGSLPDQVSSPTPGGAAVVVVHDLVPGATYDGAVTVTDDDGGEASAPFQFVVAAINRPPVADAGGPYVVVEGSSITLDGSGSTDLDGNTISLSWDLDADGTFDAPDPTTFTGTDGPSSQPVTVRACDPDGLCDTATAQVDTSNADPAIGTAGVAIDVTEATLSVTFTDVGLLDTHMISVDWGDGGPPDEVSSSVSGGDSVVVVHDYAPGATYDGTVTVTDDDGGEATASFEVVIEGGGGTGDPCLDLTPTISGTDGHDWLFGTNGDDIIFGFGGNDVIFGLSGDDIVCGGPGVDVLKGMNGNDQLFGEAGNDWIWGYSGDDVLSGGPGNDFLFGWNGNDVLEGDAGNDYLIGSKGHDELSGGVGNDYLDGGPGTDVGDGGGGSDRCRRVEMSTSCERAYGRHGYWS